MIRILTDSAADLTPEELDRYQITAVPLRIQFGDDAYLDGVTLDKAQFYTLLQNSKEFPTTSQPTPCDFEGFFESAKADGDDVVAVLLSSVLSGTYQGAQIAKDMVEYDRIHLVDSMSATAGERLLLMAAASLRDKGCSAEEIVSELDALKERICIWASLDTLEYLRRGGRLSAAAAGVGTLANMKPIITVTGGSVCVVKKCIGQKRSMEQISKLMESKRPDPAYPLFGLYTYERANCIALAEYLSKAGFGIPEDSYLNIGPSIGCHVGPGAYGVAYIAAEA